MRVHRTLSCLLLACLSLLITVGQATAQESRFSNLQILPSDIEPDSLFGVMEGFAEALDVGCRFCHARDEGFASDANPNKAKARAMIRMVQHINDDLLANLATRLDPPVRVECVTCHRGINAPRMLDDVLFRAYESAGIDSTINAYRSLREEYFGGSAYDFGPLTLSRTAWRIFELDQFADAQRLAELNVEVYPDDWHVRMDHLTFILGTAYVEGGAEQGERTYRAFKEGDRGTELREPLLNDVGYLLLGRQLHEAAIAAFELNVKEYPDAFNTYDSLGEAYLANGDTELAIANYERSLELNPDNNNARRILEEIRGSGRRDE